MSVLTVGSGGEFSTITEAVAASHDGDIVKVQAGTYVNDFPTVSSKISIEGVGGIVQLVATVPPPNGKAILTVNTDLVLSNFEISGAANPSAYGNAAAIRYQGGNLVVENCYIHDNQEGLLAGNDLNGSIKIDQSEFAFNGSLGNLTHNIYINNVGNVVLSNSYIHDVLGGGTEFRSRGPNTTIVNKRIYDNGQNANYVLDVPSGGKVVIQNNVLQKSATPSNHNVIHWGGSVVVPFHTVSSLDVTNNVIVDRDVSRQSYAVLNKSDLYNPSGQTTVPNITRNHFFGLPASQISNLPANVASNTLDPLAAAPALDVTHPWTAPTTIWDPTAYPQNLLLTTVKHNIVAGAAKLTVTDTLGNNTISGGSGGLLASVTGSHDTIVTANGAFDTIGVASSSTVRSAGNDRISGNGTRNNVTVTGHATIGGGTSGSNNYTLLNDGVVQTRGVDTINVVGCRATVLGIGTSLYATETGGAVQFTATGGPVSQALTVSGGLATIAGSASGAVITTSASTGTSVALGSGAEQVKSYGADTISAGGSAAIVNVSGTARVFAGTGSLQVNGVAGVASVTGGASSFTFIGTAGGLNYVGDTGTANIRAGSTAITVTGGSGNVTLVGGAGNDLFTAGSGQAVVTPGAGNDTVQFGSGNTTVTGGAGGDLYRCVVGNGGGIDLIRNFKAGTDKLDLGGTAIQRQSVVAGSLNLNLADGTTIILSGVSKFASNMLA